jgi:hypothetical protein
MTFTHRRASALIAALVGNLKKTFSIPRARSMLSSESVPLKLLLCGAAFNPNEEKLFTGQFWLTAASRTPLLSPRLRRFAITYAACPVSELDGNTLSLG